MGRRERDRGKGWRAGGGGGEGESLVRNDIPEGGDWYVCVYACMQTTPLKMKGLGVTSVCVCVCVCVLVWQSPRGTSPRGKRDLL